MDVYIDGWVDGKKRLVDEMYTLMGGWKEKVGGWNVYINGWVGERRDRRQKRQIQK